MTRTEKFILIMISFAVVLVAIENAKMKKKIERMEIQMHHLKIITGFREPGINGNSFREFPEIFNLQLLDTLIVHFLLPGQFFIFLPGFFNLQTMVFREFELQSQISSYLIYQYPDVDFLSDTVASVKLTMPQAQRNKKVQKPGFKCPDLLILEPRGEYHGLFIELKASTPYKKCGNELKKNQHNQEQDKQLKKFEKKGYRATFAWSFEMARSIIDNYMKKEKNY